MLYQDEDSSSSKSEYHFYYIRVIYKKSHGNLSIMDTGCSLEDLPEVMDETNGEWIREICASSMTW